MKTNNQKPNRTLREYLIEMSNDYSAIEKQFNLSTKNLIVSASACEVDNIDEAIKHTSHSIIIPSYRLVNYLEGLLTSLDYQKSKREFEVIVVHGSETEELSTILRMKPKNYKLNVIKLNDSHEISYTRNVGLAYASGEIISFVDSDFVLPDNFVRERIFHALCSEEAVLAGLHHNITPGYYLSCFESLKENGFQFNGDYKLDSRYRGVLLPEHSARTGISFEGYGKEYMLLHSTDNFKNFGNLREESMWNLHSMVMSGNLTLHKNLALKAGGFDTRFIGWGFEDANFGARLIASGAFIIPTYSSVPYRVKTQPRTGDEATKMREARLNYARYLSSLEEIFETDKLQNDFAKTYSIGELEKSRKIKILRME